MPTPRKHVSNLAENTRKRNVGRYKDRESEPKLANLSRSAPKHLAQDLRPIWSEVVRSIPRGTLLVCDRIIVELTVQLTFQMRRGTLTAAQIGQLRGCLASLGITPADRSRVKAPPPPPVKSALDRILDGDDETDEPLREPLN